MDDFSGELIMEEISFKLHRGDEYSKDQNAEDVTIRISGDWSAEKLTFGAKRDKLPASKYVILLTTDDPDDLDVTYDSEDDLTLIIPRIECHHTEAESVNKLYCELAAEEKNKTLAKGSIILEDDVISNLSGLPEPLISYMKAIFTNAADDHLISFKNGSLINITLDRLQGLLGISKPEHTEHFVEFDKDVVNEVLGLAPLLINANLHSFSHVLSQVDIDNKSISNSLLLNAANSNAVLVYVDNASFRLRYGIDYTITDSTISWNGLGAEVSLKLNDVLKVYY